MPTKISIMPILDFDQTIDESPASLLEYCKDLEKSVEELSHAIEVRRRNKEFKLNLKKKD